MPQRAPVLFLPGLLNDARLWRDQVEALADVADPRVADLTQDDTVEAMARRALADAPPTFALVALSMGGYVAFEILRQAPARVTRLALFATSAAPDSPKRAERRRAAISSVAHGRFVGVSKRLLPQLVHPDRVHDAIGEEVRAMAERVGKDAFLRQQAAILARPDSRPLLPGIAVPTLVGVGDADVLTPYPQSEAMRRAIPGASLHVFGRCGHLPAMERPAAVSALLRGWLAE